MDRAGDGGSGCCRAWPAAARAVGAAVATVAMAGLIYWARMERLRLCTDALSQVGAASPDRGAAALECATLIEAASLTG